MKFFNLELENAFLTLDNNKTFLFRQTQKVYRQNSFTQFSIFCEDVGKAEDLRWNTRIYGSGWKD